MVVGIRPARHHYTYEEYLGLNEYSTVKLEFIAGEIHAMAGGTPEHAALAFALGRIIGTQLPETCTGFTSDLRVRVVATDMATYPDLTVVCGKTMRDSLDRLAVTNPVLIVEVTSDSTEEYDRNEKRERYQQIPSLREYVLVSHRRPELEIWRRRGERGAEDWTSETVVSGEVALLASIGSRVDVDELYRSVIG